MVLISSLLKTRGEDHSNNIAIQSFIMYKLLNLVQIIQSNAKLSTYYKSFKKYKLFHVLQIIQQNTNLSNALYALVNIVQIIQRYGNLSMKHLYINLRRYTPFGVILKSTAKANKSQSYNMLLYKCNEGNLFYY